MIDKARHDKDKRTRPQFHRVERQTGFVLPWQEIAAFNFRDSYFPHAEFAGK